MEEYFWKKMKMAINVDVDANDLKFLFKNLSRIGKIGDEEDFFFFFPRSIDAKIN